MHTYIWLSKLFMGIRHISDFMTSAFMVMAFSWLAWFPFFMFPTVGWEKGDPLRKIQTGMNWKLLYTMARGTRRSFWALIQLNSAKNQSLVDCTTLLKVRITFWIMGNFSLFAAMACTAMMSSSSSLTGTTNAPKLEQVVVGCHCKAAILFLFSAFGFPLAITYSLPCSKFDCCCCWTT